MLVLTRKKNQRIRIGKDVEVVVTLIDQDKVRLGIIAPKDVLIMRDDAGPSRRVKERLTGESHGS